MWVIALNACPAFSVAFTSRSALEIAVRTCLAAVPDGTCSPAIGSWDVSAITDMSYLFSLNAKLFNADISEWNVSAVTNMQKMFWVAEAFNQPIGSWDVRAVTNMECMFTEASAFNQPIGSWNVSAVTNMARMFRNADAFNQPIGSWNVSAVTDMSWMFSDADAFNQPIGSWNVNAVTDMSGMFSDANAFNQPIGSWNVSAVTDMSWMFIDADAFNQPIGSWNVNAVTNMEFMFYNADAFNQPIGSWNVSAVTDMSDMFTGATAFNENLCSPVWVLKRDLLSSSKYRVCTTVSPPPSSPPPPSPPPLSPPQPLQPGGAWVTRVQFDVHINVSAGRRNRQLTPTVGTDIDYACRFLLIDLLGDASNVVVSEIGANIFRVTISLDSASAYLVEDFVKRPDFADRLFTRLSPLVGNLDSIKKYVEAVGAPMPPPPSPPFVGLVQPLIAIVLGGVAVIIACVVYISIVINRYKKRRQMIIFTLTDPRPH